MTNIQINQSSFIIDNNPVEVVTQFKYLGDIFSFKCNLEEEINNRISAAWKSFWSLKRFLLSKMPIFQDTCVLPLFTYGCQT
jgi:hypothetical protein